MRMGNSSAVMDEVIVLSAGISVKSLTSCDKEKPQSSVIQSS